MKYIYVFVVGLCGSKPRSHLVREADIEGVTTRCGHWIANDHWNSGRMPLTRADLIAARCKHCFWTPSSPAGAVAADAVPAGNTTEAGE